MNWSLIWTILTCLPTILAIIKQGILLVHESRVSGNLSKPPATNGSVGTNPIISVAAPSIPLVPMATPPLPTRTYGPPPTPPLDVLYPTDPWTSTDEAHFQDIIKEG